MAKTFDLSVIFNVIDKGVSKTVDKIGASVGRLSMDLQKVSQKFNGFGQKMKDFGSKASGLGKNLSMKLTLPLVGFAAIAGKTAIKFDESMNKVSAVTGATGKDLKMLEDRALEMGSATQFSASESAEAMTFLGMAGLKTAEIYEALPGVLQLAAAGGLDLASAADIATNVMTSMSLSVKDLAHVNDILAFAANNANTDVRQLAEALRPVASTADSLGIPLEEVTAQLAKMADSGEKGGAAGTFLRNAMIAVVKPTDKAKEAFVKMGINLADFVTESGKLKNFSGMMELIQKQGAKVEDVFDAFGVRGARAVLTLTKKGKNIKEFTKSLKMSSGAMDQATRDMIKNLKNLGLNTDAWEGAASKAQKAMQKGLPGAMNRLKSTFEALMLSIVKSGIGKKVENFINKIADLFAWFSKLDPAVLGMVSAIVAIAAVIGPLILLIGGLSTALGALSGVSLPLVAGIAGIAFVFGLFAKAGGPLLGIIAALTVAMLVFTGVSAPLIAIVAAISLVTLGVIKLIKHFTGLDIVSKVLDGIGSFFGFGGEEIKVKGAKVAPNVKGAIAKNKDGKSETDIKVSLSMPDQVSGVVTSKRQKGDNSKLTLKLGDRFAGPVLAGVQ